MMIPPYFWLAELVGTTGSTTKRFFILETTVTSDGPRTRVCDGRWGTQDEAEAELKVREEKTSA